MKTMINILIIIIMMTVTLHAQSPEEAVRILENEQGIGAKANAMGNAAVAAIDDWTALYWNPAALTLLKSSEISGSLFARKFINNTHFAGTEHDGDKLFNQFKSFGLAYKFPTVQGSFAIGLGYHRFKEMDDYLKFNGFNTYSNWMEFDVGLDQEEWHWFDQDVYQAEEVIHTGHVGAWSFGGGIQLSPNFSFGLSIHALQGNGKYQFSFYQEDVNNVYDAFPGNFYSYTLNQHIDADFSGWYSSLGGLLQLTKELRAGFSYDFPMNLTVNETWRENDELVFDDGYYDAIAYEPGEWDYIIRYPGKLSGGLALDTKNLLIALSGSYRDWTRTEFKVPGGYYIDADYQSLLDENPRFQQEFRPVFSWGLGGEFRIPNSGVKLRGGYRTVPSPLENADTELERHYFSGGLGFDLDKTTSINLTVVRGYWTRYSEDSYTPGGTKESIETDKVSGGITFKF